MFYKHKEDVRWGNKCPRCNSQIVWSMSNARAGSKASARCSKSPLNSVVTTNIRKLRFCYWSGEAIRQGDGSVRIKSADGIWLR